MRIFIFVFIVNKCTYIKNRSGATDYHTKGSVSKYNKNNRPKNAENTSFVRSLIFIFCICYYCSNRNTHSVKFQLYTSVQTLNESSFIENKHHKKFEQKLYVYFLSFSDLRKRKQIILVAYWELRRCVLVSFLVRIFI